VTSGRWGQPITNFPIPEAPLRTQLPLPPSPIPSPSPRGCSPPGHLGELTQYLPFELVDDILEQNRTVQQRLRNLPSRTGVYFLLAMGMFPDWDTPGSGRS
jgi:hypothetical protein